jgi:hypothetical protein
LSLNRARACPDRFVQAVQGCKAPALAANPSDVCLGWDSIRHAQYVACVLWVRLAALCQLGSTWDAGKDMSIPTTAVWC